MSLRRKIALWYVSTLVVLFLVFSLSLCLLLKKTEERSLELELFAKAEELEDALEQAPADAWPGILKDFPVQVAQIYEVSADEIKVLLSKPQGYPPLGLKEAERWAKRGIKGEYLLLSESLDGEVYDVVFMKLSEETPVKIVAVASSLEGVTKTVRHLVLIVLMVMPLLVVLAFLTSNILVKVSLTPVRRVIETAKAISVEDLSKRIPEVETKDEIGELVRTFNSMMEKLEESVNAIKRFSSDAAHELKTPLTALKSHLEFLLRENRCSDCEMELRQVLARVDRLIHIVNSLLVLAKLDSMDVRNLKNRVALDVVVLEVFERFQQQAQKRAIKLLIDRVDPVEVIGDAVLLSQAISNIVDNAVKFTPSGGEVRISLVKDGDKARLSISDTGVGMSQEELGKIFSYLYRGDPSRSERVPGIGLGLTIAKRIFELHDASVKVESDPGRGTSFHITFITQD